MPGRVGIGGLVSSEKRRPPRGGGGVGALSMIGDLVESCEVVLGGLRRVESFRDTGEAFLASGRTLEGAEGAGAEVEGTMMVRLTTALNGSAPSRMTRARALTFALVEPCRDGDEDATGGELVPSCLGVSEEPARVICVQLVEVVESDRCNRKPLIISSSSPKDLPACRNAAMATSSSGDVATIGGEAIWETTG
jgi:hypothetical protein